MANPNDSIRNKILRYLYGLRGKARGPKSLEVGIRELQAGLKKDKIKQSDLISNLDYLVQKGWVRRTVETRPYTTPQGFTRQNEKVTYKISDVGIDRLEGASSYRREDTFSRINVTTIRGVTVIGSGNVVNTNFTDASELLSELEKQLATSEGISDEDQLNALADIGTIQSQLAKPEPDMTIVQRAWHGAERIVTAAGLVELGAKIAMVLGLG